MCRRSGVSGRSASRHGEARIPPTAGQDRVLRTRRFNIKTTDCVVGTAGLAALLALLALLALPAQPHGRAFGILYKSFLGPAVAGAASDAAVGLRTRGRVSYEYFA